MLQPDVVVIGGGVAGLTVAASLADRGIRTVVVDRQACGTATSAQAAGMLAPLVEARSSEQDLLHFGVAALQFWREYRTSIGLNDGEEYRSDGTLLVGSERDHAGQIDHIAEEYRALGLSIREIDRSALRKQHPLLAPGIARGYLSESDHHVDPRALLRRLIDRCTADTNVTIVEDFAVDSIARLADGNYTLQSYDRVIGAPAVVISGGAASRTINLVDLPESAAHALSAIRPVVGDIIALDASRFPVVRSVVRTPDVYLVPHADRLLVGASSEERGFADKPRAGAVYELLRSAAETVPSTWEMPINGVAVGHRPATIDHAPMIGLLDGAGLYVASGYYRHGILFAPLAADLLVRYIADHEEDERLAPFDPLRFSDDPAER